jgi:hypothetical protein
MSDASLYPLRLEPIFQYRLWGGRRLGDWMASPLPDGPIGEAWVLSDRDDHASRVAEGPLKGATLKDLIARAKGEILGDLADRFDRFPMLLKFLDVNQMLSVQVHPRDDMAHWLPPGETGKTESWVVLEADPKSRIYAGLKPKTTADDLRALTTATADEHLASFHPEVGQGVLTGTTGTPRPASPAICRSMRRWPASTFTKAPSAPLHPWPSRRRGWGASAISTTRISACGASRPRRPSRSARRTSPGLWSVFRAAAISRMTANSMRWLAAG